MSQKPTISKCKVCKIPWQYHAGVVETCRQLQAAITALRVIHTWASVDGALDAAEVRRLCKRTLDKVAA